MAASCSHRSEDQRMNESDSRACCIDNAVVPTMASIAWSLELGWACFHACLSQPADLDPEKAGHSIRKTGLLAEALPERQAGLLQDLARNGLYQSRSLKVRESLC